MKKRILLVSTLSIICILIMAFVCMLVMAACHAFSGGDTSSQGISGNETVSIDSTTGESSVGNVIDDTGVPVSSTVGNETSSDGPASAIGGNDAQMGGASSNPVSSTSSNTTSSADSNQRPTTSSAVTSSTASEEGNSGRPGSDNEYSDISWGQTSSAETSSTTEWIPSVPPTSSEDTSSVTSSTSSVPPAVEDDETPTSSTEDPDGPGWIQGWY